MMNSIGTLISQQSEQQINSSFLPHSSSDSCLSVYNTLLVIGVGISTFAIAYAWNKLRGRRIMPISPKDPKHHSVTEASLLILIKEKKEKSPVKKETGSLTPLPLPSLSLTSSSMILPMAVSFEMFEKFYQNQGKDVRGRKLLDLQNMSFSDKEWTHDYIQWLFPTDQESAFNSNAPVFDLKQFKALSQNPVIKENVRRSFFKMMEFYGLQYDSETAKIYKNSDFEEKARNWLTLGNHNLLRISRILRSLVLFGFTNEPQAFYQFLNTLRSHPALTEENFFYWENAIKSP